MNQADLAGDIGVSSGNLSRRLNGKLPLRRSDVELIIEKLADRGAFWYKDQVRELLGLTDFEDLFEELEHLPRIHKLLDTPPVAIKPVSEPGRQRETQYPNTLNEAQERTEYLEQVYRQFGAVTLPLGPGHLSLEAIYRPLKLRQDALAAEDLVFEERRALLDEPRTDEDPRRIPLEKWPSGDGRGIDEEPIAIANNGDEAIERSPRRRLVILGPPGSGKTTTLRSLMANAARQALLNPSKSPLPIYISLPEFAQSGKTLQQYLRTVAANAGVDERFGEALWKAVREGRAFVCLDDLDYVAPHRRAQIIDWINARATEPGNVWVIGSRFSEFKTAQLAQDQFLEWELLPMNHEYRLALAEKLVPLLQELFHRIRDDSAYTPSSFVEHLEAHPRAADWGKNPLLYSLAAVVFVRTGKLPLSRAELYQVVIEAVLETRLKDTLRQTTLRMVLSALALELYMRHQRTITREALLRLLAEIRTRQAENWNTEELARDIINSGIVETVAKATYGYWHSSFHEYFAAAELAGSLARREAERWELVRKKHTYSRWTEVLRLTVGVLVNEYHDEGIDVALDWLRELAEQRKSPEGDPGDLGLALVLTSLGEVGDRAALWTNSSWVQLEEAVANTWIQAILDASLHQQVVRQKRLLNMAQDLGHLCPSAISLVVDRLASDAFSKKRCTYAAALQALGKLGRQAPIEQLLRALPNKYESIRQTAVQALAELDKLVPKEALISVLESESYVDRAAAAQVVGEIGYHELIDHLIPGLDDKHELVREACVQALGNMGEQAPLDTLLECLRDETSSVRLAAVEALGKLGGRVPMNALRPALDDPDDIVRAAAIEILDIHTPASILVREIASDPDPLSRSAYYAATEVLGKLDEHTFSDIVSSLNSNNLKERLTWIRESQRETPMEELFEALHSNDRDLCVDAARILALRKAWTPLEEFVTAAQSMHDYTRAIAVRLLAEFGKDTPMEQILAALSDENPHIRLAALRALKDMEDPLPLEAIAAAACISDENKAIRTTALKVLARVAEHVPIDASFLEALAHALIDRDWYTRSAARLCLERLRVRVPQGLMARLFTHENAAIRRAALTVFGKDAQNEMLSKRVLKIKTPRSAYREWKLVAELCKEWRSTTPDIVEAALPFEYLETWDPHILPIGNLSGAGVQRVLVPSSDEQRFVDPLTKAKRDLSDRIRDEGLQALRQCAPVDGLIAVLNDESGEARRIAIQALGERAPEDRLILALDDEDCQVRRAAILVLRERMPIEELMAALNDEYYIVREAALEVVRTLGTGLPEALLVEALEHPNGSMRASAIRALGVRAPAEKLLPALGDSYEEVRLAAADTLRLTHPETWQVATSEVMTVLTLPGTSTILDSAAQCFLADLIGGLEQASPSLLETLSRLLMWPYWEVQVRAAQALGQLRRSIPESALRRLYTLRKDSVSKTVRRSAEDALAEILSLQAGIEDDGYESVDPPTSAGE